jgi:hypothetical protein
MKENIKNLFIQEANRFYEIFDEFPESKEIIPHKMREIALIRFIDCIIAIKKGNFRKLKKLIYNGKSIKDEKTYKEYRTKRLRKFCNYLQKLIDIYKI